MNRSRNKEGLITTARKRTARAIRPTSRKNADGGVSTHLMQSGTVGDGKYKYQVNPTIFPNKDGSWTDLGNDKDKWAAYKEANKRGEVFGFKREKQAEKFAYGSWKKGKDKREAMRNYREDKRNK
jgi:hypothetical protein